MGGNEAGALHEHAAGAAGGIEDAPVKGLQHLDQEADDAGGREELAALLPLAHGEGAEEVFIDLPEGVALQIGGDGGEGLQQVAQQAGIEDLMRGAKAADPAVRLHVRADRVAAHRFVKGVIDASAKGGVVNVIFSTHVTDK